MPDVRHRPFSLTLTSIFAYQNVSSRHVRTKQAVGLHAVADRMDQARVLKMISDFYFSAKGEEPLGT